MSRETLLDEAIVKAKADGDVQLAEWLRRARGADAAARWYSEKLRDAHRTIRKLLNENAELRKHVRMPDEPLEIDEKDFYVRAFIKWATEEQPEVKRLEAENAELRELVRYMWDWLAPTAINGGAPLHRIVARMRELGVEV